MIRPSSYENASLPKNGKITSRKMSGVLAENQRFASLRRDGRSSQNQDAIHPGNQTTIIMPEDWAFESVQ
jgi:hypothetical protein